MKSTPNSDLGFSQLSAGYVHNFVQAYCRLRHVCPHQQQGLWSNGGCFNNGLSRPTGLPSWAAIPVAWKWASAHAVLIAAGLVPVDEETALGAAWAFAGQRALRRAGLKPPAAALAADAAGRVSAPFWPRRQPPAQRPVNTPAGSPAATYGRALGLTTLALSIPDHSIDHAFRAQRLPSRVALTDTDYQALTRNCWRASKQADAWLQDDVIDIDTQPHWRLARTVVSDGSKIVVNTQPPLQEVWLAARAGGFHYGWSGSGLGRHATAATSLDALSEQASRQGGRALRFKAG